MLSRRDFVLASLASMATGRSLFGQGPASPTPVITVYKDPSCGCCTKWVKHLSSNGFVVTTHDVQNMDDIKRAMNVPVALQSCHTAVVDRYVIEGHVPADLVKKILTEKPAILGLAVPGMPAGSPGMEGDHVEHYNVVAFDRDGKTHVFAKR